MGFQGNSQGKLYAAFRPAVANEMSNSDRSLPYSCIHADCTVDTDISRHFTSQNTPEYLFWTPGLRSKMTLQLADILHPAHDLLQH